MIRFIAYFSAGRSSLHLIISLLAGHGLPCPALVVTQFDELGHAGKQKAPVRSSCGLLGLRKLPECLA